MVSARQKKKCRFDRAVECAGNNEMGLLPSNTVRGTTCEVLRSGFFL